MKAGFRQVRRDAREEGVLSSPGVYVGGVLGIVPVQESADLALQKAAKARCRRSHIQSNPAASRKRSHQLQAQVCR